MVVPAEIGPTVAVHSVFTLPGSGDKTMTTEPLQHTKLKFDEDGFAIVRGFIDRDEVERINNEVERYIDDVVPRLPDGSAFYEIKGDPATLKQLPRISEHDKFFQDFHCHSRMSELARHVLGCDVAPRDLQWFNKPPKHGKPTPAHQDGFYDKIKPIDMVNMWLALDPVDEQNGCVRYVAGSHKQGLRKHARTNTLGFSQGLVDFNAADRAGEIAVCAKPGDMLLHHGLTIHRADGNSSPRHRRAMGSVYYGAHVKRDEALLESYHHDLTREMIREGKL